MNRLLLYNAILFSLIFISMFFLYETHFDLIEPSKNGLLYITYEDVHVSGFDIWPSFMALGIILLTTALVYIKRTIAPAIIAFIISIPMFLFLLIGLDDFDFMLLDFKFLSFDRWKESELKFGFYILFISFAIYTLLLVVNIFVTGKRSRIRKASEQNNSILLDDF